MRLPPEMLTKIFRHLHGKDMLSCRDVCLDWRDAVDDLPDTVWRKKCLSETYYQDYIAARKKYGLSWRDTYRALNSWGDIASADMMTRKLGDVKMQHFKVQPNEVIACYQCNRIKNAPKGHSDTIVYYNLQTIQECGRDEFDFSFYSIHSEITKHFYVLVDDKEKVWIVIRENMKKFFVSEITEKDFFSVIGAKVYFRNKDDSIIYFSELVKNNESTEVKTTALVDESFTEEVLAYAKKRVNGNLNILTHEGLLYVCEDEYFDCVGKMEGDLDELQQYGFDWHSLPIFNWLLFHERRSYEHIKKFFVHFQYGNGVIILSTDRSVTKLKIHNYKNDIFDMWNLKNAIRSKDLRKISFERPINQMDIVETATSHKILVLCNEELHICEFQYGNCNNEHGIDDNSSLPKKRENPDEAETSAKKVAVDKC